MRVVSMDPVTLIVAALVAGVSSGVGDVAASGVRDAYEGLKGLLVRRLAGDEHETATVEEHVADPETHEELLAEEIRATGADQDAEILAAAEDVLRRADAAGVETKYNVTVTGGKVGVIGDDAHIGTMNL
jgi:hypothetical protein